MAIPHIGNSKKAPTTVAESLHEAEGTIGQTKDDSAPRPEYGASTPSGQRYYSQQVDGQPHVPRIRQDPLVPTKSGYVTAVPLPYEIYGTGPIHIVFLTGVGLSRHSWLYQVDYFARKPEYSVLVIDNRGSDSHEPHIPLKFAGTKQYARDVKAALEALDWAKPKSVHVVGFSFGAFVGLQLGRVCPEYVASLHLVSGAAKFKGASYDTVNYVNGASLVKIEGDAARAARLVDLLFPPEYLYAHDPDWPEWRNNRDRFLAPENLDKLLPASQNWFGYYGQILATAKHGLDQAKLWQVAAHVKYIFVSAGDRDFLLHESSALDLMHGLNAQGRIYKGSGHMVQWQEKDAFNLDEEAMIQRAHREYQEYPPPATLLAEE